MTDTEGGGASERNYKDQRSSSLERKDRNAQKVKMKAAADRTDGSERSKVDSPRLVIDR